MESSIQARIPSPLAALRSTRRSAATPSLARLASGASARLDYRTPSWVRLLGKPRVSVLCPARNEAATIALLCRRTLVLDLPLELLVIDDGSTDATAALARLSGARVLSHATARGNGAAIKSGLAAARGEFAVILDADGQHDPAAIPLLVKGLLEGADLVVACRPDYRSSGFLRGLGNRFLARLASYMAERRIPDLTSGLRAFRMERMRPFIPLLPDGFSTPTTSTLAFLHAGCDVRFESVACTPRPRGSRTHTHLLRDGLLFVSIAFRITTLFRPRRAVLPLAVGCVVAAASLLPLGVLLDFSPLPAAAAFTAAAGAFGLLGQVFERRAAPRRPAPHPGTRS